MTGPDGAGRIAVKATGVTGIAKLDITPNPVQFADIPVGLSATQTITVANNGNLTLTVTKAAPPTLPFVVNTPLPEGQVLNPGDVIQVQITFSPTTAGTFHGLYTISSDDGKGAHQIPVTATALPPGHGQNPLPNMLGGGWVYNGSARMAGQDLVLTTAKDQQAGSAIFSTPLPSDDLSATFTAHIGGGNGGDGLTFALLAASSNAPNTVGELGEGLGFLGLPGVAVTLDTYREDNDPSANFIGLTTGGVNGKLAYAATATNIPDLRTGTHTVQITTHGGVVSVVLDGTPVLSQAVKLPPSVLVAFTGSTGGWYDSHTVTDVAIHSGSTSLPPPGTGWWFNGAAVTNGPEAVLTPAEMQQSGSVLYANPVRTDGLTASFSMTSFGGTGADGISFVLLDPRTAPTSVGASGSGLGYGGLKGVAVSFLTYPEGDIKQMNWVTVATSSGHGDPVFGTRSTDIPPLRQGIHSAVVQIKGTTLIVSIDGLQVLHTSVPSLGPTAIVGFVASTGHSTDVHSVSNAQILAAAG